MATDWDRTHAVPIEVTGTPNKTPTPPKGWDSCLEYVLATYLSADPLVFLVPLLAAARAELKALRGLAGIGAAHFPPVDVGGTGCTVLSEYSGPTVTCTFTCPKCGETATETNGRAGTDGATDAPAPAAGVEE